MKVKSILNHTAFLLLLAIFFANCDKKTTNEVDEPTDKEKFCSHVNAANIDQTIPIVNQFLSGLSAELNDERQLQELTAWLASCPCIVDAEILPTSEILISFVENGTTKRFVIAVTMEKPLKIAGYSEYEEPAVDEFCTFLNAANIEKTIPFVDEFLSGLPAELDGEQQLQALAAWLQSQSCITGADVLCNQCYISNPLKSEILISFDENGTTKRFSMFLSMAQPSKVEGYHEYLEPVEIPSWDYFLSGPWSWSSGQWNAPWGELPNRPSDKVFVINGKDDLEMTLVGSPYFDLPNIDFSKHSLLLVGGTNPGQLIISDIFGSLRKHAAHYVLHVDVKRYDAASQNEPKWFYAMITEKLSDESIIEATVSYSKNETENFYYVFEEKIFLQQRQDKIHIQFAPDAEKEQVLGIIKSDASLQLGYTSKTYTFETLEASMKNPVGLKCSLRLESKNGSRIPLATLESLQSREEVVFATYMFSSGTGSPVAFTNEFIVMLKPTTTYAQLQELAEKYHCTVSDEDMLQRNEFVLYVSSKSNAMQMANLFQETGLFEYSSPNFLFTSNH